MKMFLIVWRLSLHLFLFYASGFELGKINLRYSEIFKSTSLTPINSNFYLTQKLTLNNTNEYIFIIPALLVGIVLVFFWMKFINKRQIKELKSNKLEVNVQFENSETNENKPEISSKVIILEETEQRILDRLEDFERSNQFNRREISLYNLSHEINTNTKYLSSIIKKHKNKSFNNYINELRIEYIVQKLKHNPTYLNYKISHLAEEVGFSSHSAFSSVFYQITGIKPSVFIKNLKEEINNDSL